MEQRRNAWPGGRGMGDPRENGPTSGIDIITRKVHFKQCFQKCSEVLIYRRNEHIEEVLRRTRVRGGGDGVKGGATVTQTPVAAVGEAVLLGISRGRLSAAVLALEIVLMQNKLSAHECSALALWCNFLSFVVMMRRNTLEVELEQRFRKVGTVCLLVSNHGDPGSIHRRVTPDFCMWESCRTMPLVDGFSRGSPVSPAFSFQRYPIFTSITVIGSQNLDAKSHPNVVIHSCSTDELRRCLHHAADQWHQRELENKNFVSARGSVVSYRNSCALREIRPRVLTRISANIDAGTQVIQGYRNRVKIKVKFAPDRPLSFYTWIKRVTRTECKGKCKELCRFAKLQRTSRCYNAVSSVIGTEFAGLISIHFACASTYPRKISLEAIALMTGTRSDSCHLRVPAAGCNDAWKTTSSQQGHKQASRSDSSPYTRGVPQQATGAVLLLPRPFLNSPQENRQLRAWDTISEASMRNTSVFSFTPRATKPEVYLVLKRNYWDHNTSSVRGRGPVLRCNLFKMVAMHMLFLLSSPPMHMHMQMHMHFLTPSTMCCVTSFRHVRLPEISGVVKPRPHDRGRCKTPRKFGKPVEAAYIRVSGRRRDTNADRQEGAHEEGDLRPSQAASRGEGFTNDPSPTHFVPFADLELGQARSLGEGTAATKAKYCRGRGGIVARLLVSHQGEPGSVRDWVAPGFSHVGIMPDDTAGWRVFSGITRFPRPCIPASAPNSPRFTPIGSQNHDVFNIHTFHMWKKREYQVAVSRGVTREDTVCHCTVSILRISDRGDLKSFRGNHGLAYGVASTDKAGLIAKVMWFCLIRPVKPAYITFNTIILTPVTTTTPTPSSPRIVTDFRTWEFCRTMPLVDGFLGDLPFPPFFHSDAAPYSYCVTHTSSHDIDVKSRPTLAIRGKLSTSESPAQDLLVCTVCIIPLGCMLHWKPLYVYLKPRLKLEWKSSVKFFARSRTESDQQDVLSQKQEARVTAGNENLTRLGLCRFRRDKQHAWAEIPGVQSNIKIYWVQGIRLHSHLEYMLPGNSCMCSLAHLDLQLQCEHSIYGTVLYGNAGRPSYSKFIFEVWEQSEKTDIIVRPRRKR
ncbi:hypothetical protein PR048_009633, partial [Dryococelus australis]